MSVRHTTGKTAAARSMTAGPMIPHIEAQIIRERTRARIAEYRREQVPNHRKFRRRSTRIIEQNGPAPLRWLPGRSVHSLRARGNLR